MLWSAKTLLGYRLHEEDGLLGRVHDLYFDDKRWEVSHVVATLQARLVRRKVLVAPSLLGPVNAENQMIHVEQTREEVLHDPGRNTARPVYRQFEEQAREYYQWVAHWTPFSGLPEPRTELVFTGDSHLRSVHHLLGYHVQARGAAVGRVADFLLDDDGWKVVNLVIETGNGTSRREGLIAPEKVAAFDWEQRTIQLDLDPEAVRNAPEYAPAQRVS